ncbi:MAG: M20/M25/M40 family metallo-hydrolase, partial [Bacillota bacterium]
FEDFISRIAETDEWLRLNPPEVEWMVDADCGEIPADHPFVKTLSENVIKMARPGDGENIVRGVHGHTDMGLLIDNGISTVNFGPGLPSIAHQPDEHILLADYLNAVKIIASTLVDWCEVDF